MLTCDHAYPPYTQCFNKSGEVSLYIFSYRLLSPPPTEAEGDSSWTYAWTVEPTPPSRYARRALVHRRNSTLSIHSTDRNLSCQSTRSHIVARVRPSGTDTYFSRPVFRYIKGEREMREPSRAPLEEAEGEEDAERAPEEEQEDEGGSGDDEEGEEEEQEQEGGGEEAAEPSEGAFGLGGSGRLV